MPKRRQQGRWFVLFPYDPRLGGNQIGLRIYIGERIGALFIPLDARDSHLLGKSP